MSTADAFGAIVPTTATSTGMKEKETDDFFNSSDGGSNPPLFEEGARPYDTTLKELDGIRVGNLPRNPKQSVWTSISVTGLKKTKVGRKRKKNIHFFHPFLKSESGLLELNVLVAMKLSRHQWMGVEQNRY